MKSGSATPAGRVTVAGGGSNKATPMDDSKHGSSSSSSSHKAGGHGAGADGSEVLDRNARYGHGGLWVVGPDGKKKKGSGMIRERSPHMLFADPEESGVKNYEA